MPGDEFAAKLQTIVEQRYPDRRAELRQSIEQLAMDGGDTFQGVLAIVRGRRADPETRRTACEVLRQLGDKRAAPALIAALRDEDTDLGQAAALALRELGSRKAVLPLIAVLQTAVRPDMRAIASYVLGHLKDPRACEPLAQTLMERSEDPEVRGQAAEALALLGDTRSVPVLVSALDDPSPEVRFWSVFALACLGDLQVLPKLQELAETDEGVAARWGRVGDEAREAVEVIRARAGLRPPYEGP